MRMTMDDYELSKLSLAKKVKELCMQFLKDTGKERIYLKVRPAGDNTLTFDSQGKTCVGVSHSVQVMAWTEEEFDAFLSESVPQFIDEDDEDD